VAGAPPPPEGGRDEDGELRDGDLDLARLDRLVARFDAACARRDREGLRRVEEEALDDLRRELRESRRAEQGDDRAERRNERRRIQALREAADELASLRGRVDARSMDRKRAVLVDLSEGAWRELLQGLTEAEREGWSRR
jgi:hypothetical protein